MKKKLGRGFGIFLMIFGGIYAAASVITFFVILFGDEPEKLQLLFSMVVLFAFGAVLFWLGLRLRAKCTAPVQAQPPVDPALERLLDEEAAALEKDTSGDSTPTAQPELAKEGPAEPAKVRVSLSDNLFLMPMLYDGDPYVLPAPDRALHIWPKAGEMLQQGAKLLCTDGIPEGYAPATAPGPSAMHGRLLKNSQSGTEYVPLFFSFQAMFQIFGPNIRVSIISFAEAQELCKECAGIVLGPGAINCVLPGGDPSGISGNQYAKH